MERPRQCLCPLRPRRQRILRVVVVDLALGPITALDVQHVAGLVPVLTPAPTEVHAPERCAVSVDEGNERLTVVRQHLRLSGGDDATTQRETNARF